MEAAKPTKINKVSKNMVSFQKSIGQRTAEREKARKDKLEKMRKEKEEREMAHSFKPSFATKKDRKKKGPVSSPSSNSGRGAPPSPSKSTLPPEFESRQAKHLEEAAKKRAERAAAQRKKDEAETASFFKVRGGEGNKTLSAIIINLILRRNRLAHLSLPSTPAPRKWSPRPAKRQPRPEAVA